MGALANLTNEQTTTEQRSKLFFNEVRRNVIIEQIDYIKLSLIGRYKLIV